MCKFVIKKSFLLVLLYFCSAAVVHCQDIESDTISENSIPELYLRLSGGPSLIANDMGYFFHNELLVEFTKHFALSASYFIANSYEGMRNIRRGYLNPSELNEDDFVRQQSLISMNINVQASLLNSDKHRLYLGFGPGLNFYNASAGELQQRGDSIQFVLSNKRTLRLSLNYFAGYEYKAFQHVHFGLGFFGSQFTEQLNSLFFSVAYKF
jgi:opacity protein-like surface antigen